MIDKHILLEIERIVNRRLNLLQGEYFNLEEETKGMTNELIDILCSIEPTIEALHTEYEKGRADALANALTLDEIKGMENQAFLAGVEAERNKSILKNNDSNRKIL